MTTTRLLRHAGIFAAAALIAIAVGGKPAAAVGSDNPPPSTGSDKPKDDKKKSDKKKKQQNSLRELQQDKAAYAKVLEGYRAARDMILDGKYEQGIAAMHALGYDNHPDVANYVGYSYRRLGDYDQSKHWYELALAADPKHARTWSYYGMWQAEQGNRLKAEDGPEIQVHGSSQLLQALLQHRLVDEIQALIFPVTVGRGKRLFGEGLDPSGYKLLDSRVAGSGVIMARYAPTGALQTGTFG
jgi:tetratricopeptide (TPR) repeat protein